MKKIFMFLVIQMMVLTSIVYATNLDAMAPITSPATDIDVVSPVTINAEHPLVAKLKNLALFSVYGFKQEEVMQLALTENNYYVSKLGVTSWDDGAKIENITYGKVIGSCNINYMELDRNIVNSTLSLNMDAVIEEDNTYYVEMLCRDITIAYIEIDEERIVRFIDPGLFESEVIKNIINSYKTSEPELFLINSTKYLKGFYYKDAEGNAKIITYDDFASKDFTQLVEVDVEEALNEADAMYIIDVPRIDYEKIEREKLLEQQRLEEADRQNAIMTYSIIGGACVLLMAIIVFSVIKFKNIDE